MWKPTWRISFSFAGKMYCCQYCSASFAQSIELTRHVRTHTGDKPYVCRECGKGFKQANGLSVHLQNFHSEHIHTWYISLHNKRKLKCYLSHQTLQNHMTARNAGWVSPLWTSSDSTSRRCIRKSCTNVPSAARSSTVKPIWRSTWTFMTEINLTAARRVKSPIR